MYLYATRRGQAQLQLRRYQWLHGEVLSNRPNARVPARPTLHETMDALRADGRALFDSRAAWTDAHHRMLQAEQQVGGLGSEWSWSCVGAATTCKLRAHVKSTLCPRYTHTEDISLNL